MGQSDQPGQPPSATEPEKDPGRAAIDSAAADEPMSRKEEHGALEFLLGAPAALSYKITVDYETKDGMKPLTFFFKGIDAGEIDKIEQEHVNERTGTLDKLAADAAVVTKATYKIEDAAGASTAPKEESFRSIKPGERAVASGADAMRIRFGTQAGLLSGVASAIRTKAGWDADRVGKASRLLVDAAGN